MTQLTFDTPIVHMQRLGFSTGRYRVEHGDMIAVIDDRKVFITRRNTEGRYDTLECKYIDDLRAAIAHINEALGVTISGEVVRYMAYSTSTLNYAPHLHGDIVAPNELARYDEKARQVVLRDSGEPLVLFSDSDGKELAYIITALAREQYGDIATRSLHEYDKPHNHREGLTYAREWLAWLISAEYRKG